MLVIVSIILSFAILAAIPILIMGFAERICGRFARKHETRESIKADLKKQSQRFGFDISDEELDKVMDKAYEAAENGEYIKSPVEETLEEGRRRANEYAASKYWFEMFNNKTDSRR